MRENKLEDADILVCDTWRQLKEVVLKAIQHSIPVYNNTQKIYYNDEEWETYFKTYPILYWDEDDGGSLCGCRVFRRAYNKLDYKVFMKKMGVVSDTVGGQKLTFYWP
jgi:hypothetical protein